MTTAKKAAPKAAPMDSTERAGARLGLATTPDSAFIRGFRAARNPELVAARKERSAQRIDELTAQLFAEL